MVSPDAVKFGGCLGSESNGWLEVSAVSLGCCVPATLVLLFCYFGSPLTGTWNVLMRRRECFDMCSKI